jgi:cell division protein FtsI/penicillin-binding protein 2
MATPAKDREQQPRRSSGRITVVALVFAVASLALVGRLAYLQVYRYEDFKVAAEDHHLARERVLAPRGAILDRNGYPLATSVDTYDVRIDRAAWRDAVVADDAAERLAPVLGLDPADLLGQVDIEADGEYVIDEHVDFETGRRSRSWGSPA